MRLCFIAGCIAPAVLFAAEAVAPGRPAVKVASVVNADPQTGHLVRTVAHPARKTSPSVEGASSWSEVAATLDRYVHDTAQRYQVDPLLVRSVIQVESNYDPFAVSSKGAQGLMQLMPSTARRFSVKNSFDPWENIDGGIRYLKYLLTRFGDQESPETLALAAYNAGEGAVLKHGGVPPYRETADYVKKVAKKWGDAKAAAAGPAPPVAAVAAQPRIAHYVDAQGVVHFETRPSP